MPRNDCYLCKESTRGICFFFFTDHIPVNGKKGCYEYPQYVLVDPKDPYIRAYVPDQDFKLTNFVMDIRQQRKLERAKKKAENKAQAGVQQSLQ